jgi:hypothetical protein
MKDWLTEKYSSAQRVSNGIYVADFDAEQRMTKVLRPSLTRLIAGYDRRGVDEVECY